MRDPSAYREAIQSTISSDHVRTLEYAHILPNQPSVLVPPFGMENPNQITQRLAAVITDSFAGAKKNTDQGTEAKTVPDGEEPMHLPGFFPGHAWNYEKRRQAQAVLRPYLWLGPTSCAKDKSFLQSNGITMVVGLVQQSRLAKALLKAYLKSAQELGIATKGFIFESDAELVKELPTIMTCLTDHLSEKLRSAEQVGPKILVFCDVGAERSASVVAAYLMEVDDSVDVVKAIQLVQTARFSATLSDELKHLMQSYGDILKAKREMGRARGLDMTSFPNSTLRELQQPAQGEAQVLKIKRNHMDLDEEMDSDSERDYARFEGRRSFTPFADVEMDG